MYITFEESSSQQNDTYRVFSEWIPRRHKLASFTPRSVIRRSVVLIELQELDFHTSTLLRLCDVITIFSANDVIVV